MAGFVVRRLIVAVPVLVGASVIVFLLLFVLPGDPAVFIAGGRGTPAELAALRHQLGLGRPLPLLYIHWLSRVLHGDLGTSFINGFSVSQLFAQRFAVTLELAIGSLFVALFIGIPLGILSGLKAGSTLDRLVAAFNGFAIAVPVFSLGLLLQIIFGLKLHVLPVVGFVSLAEDPTANIRSMVLPSITLGLGVAAVLARFLRGSIREVMRQPHVLAARARGLHRLTIIRGHILRNALLPVITILGLQFGTLVGGAVLTEAVFNLPGLGGLLWQAMLERDYFVIQALTLFMVAAFIIVNLLTDLAYGVVDPKIRIGWK